VSICLECKEHEKVRLEFYLDECPLCLSEKTVKELQAEKEALLAYGSWLSNLVTKVEQAIRESFAMEPVEAKDHIMMRIPTLQGMATQNAVKRNGEIGWDTEKLNKAMQIFKEQKEK